MLLNNCKKILFSIIILACSVTLFAATTDLSVRFLDKANLAFEDNNIEDAYKYVNQALAVAKDKESQANVLYFAQTVYSVKLQNLLGNYDEMAFIDIQMNLEKYPNVENTKIKKLIAQDIIIRPIITEKSMMGAVDKKYTFEVAKSAKNSNQNERFL